MRDYCIHLIKLKIAVSSLCCANAVICLIMDNDCESVWNVSIYCISGEKIQIQVYCISNTVTGYRSHNVSRYTIQYTFFVS